jgi:hypothetical protein
LSACHVCRRKKIAVSVSRAPRRLQHRDDEQCPDHDVAGRRRVAGVDQARETHERVEL